MKRDKSEVNLHNSSRKQKSNRLDLVDSISPLPDSILGLILSLLPTKNVVSTSVLSKRWKFAWMTVHNLDFYHEGYEEELVEGEDIKFVKFVNRVLFLLDDGLLNKFHLVWKTNCISSHVCSWIETAIRRNVHELFLCVGTPVVGLGPSDVPYSLQMPTSVFKCDSLKSLELRGDISISATTMVYLPKLESLKLVSVFFESEEAFERLISGCLILNYLHVFVDFLYREDYFEYIISSNSLRRLEVSFENYQCGLRIKASSLEYLEIKGYMYRLFVQKNLSSLVGVYLRIEMVDDDLSSNSIIEAVRAFDCAKSLNLSSDVMEGLCCAEFFSATKFTRLVKFEAQICGSCDYSSLQDLLEQSKSLEVLTIHQDISCLHGNDHAASNWSILVEVPICLVKCLKMVEIVGYHGLDSERAMISYILKHGSALEVMKITWDVFISKNAKLALVEEICKFPRKSPVCEVEFFKSHLRSLFPHLDDD